MFLYLCTNDRKKQPPEVFYEKSSLRNFAKFAGKQLHWSLFFKSRSQMFFKIRFLKNFTNFTGKHLYWSLVLIKAFSGRLATLLKRDFT